MSRLVKVTIDEPVAPLLDIRHGDEISLAIADCKNISLDVDENDEASLFVHERHAPELVVC